MFCLDDDNGMLRSCHFTRACAHYPTAMVNVTVTALRWVRRRKSIKLHRQEACWRYVIDFLWGYIRGTMTRSGSVLILNWSSWSGFIRTKIEYRYSLVWLEMCSGLPLVLCCTGSCSAPTDLQSTLNCLHSPHPRHLRTDSVWFVVLWRTLPSLSWSLLGELYLYVLRISCQDLQLSSYGDC